MEANIEFRNLILEVEYCYQPYEPEVRYLRDGSGYPSCPSEVSVSEVKHCGESIMDLISGDILDEIEAQTLEHHEER